MPAAEPPRHDGASAKPEPSRASRAVAASRLAAASIQRIGPPQRGQEFVRLRGIVGPLWVSPPDTPGCQSSIPGYEGVIDLSGNVMEWEDSCVEVGGGRHRCRMRGGSYLATDIRCATIDDEFMGDLHTSMGFRCCAY